MLTKIFKYSLLLVSVAVVCISCKTKAEESNEMLKSTVSLNLRKKVPTNISLLDPQLAGEEHNRALSFLVEKFDSNEAFTYDEVFDMWLDYAQSRLDEYGCPKYLETEIEMFYKSFEQLYSFCNTQFAGDAVISYLNYMDANGLISKELVEYCTLCISDIDFEKDDPYQINESMMKQISFLDNKDKILAQNMIGIAEYSSVYWNEFFSSKAPQIDTDSWTAEVSEKGKDEISTELKGRNENVHELCAVCIDVFVGFGVASTGAGSLACGLVSAAGSFIFKEIMGW